MPARTIYLDRDLNKWLIEQHYTTNISSLFNRLLRNFIKYHAVIEDAEFHAAGDTFNEIQNSLELDDE